MSGLYIHIPFCRRKCYYCDFYSVGARLAPWPRLVDAILQEWKERCIPDVRTIYIGGGTPSTMPGEELSRLLDGLHSLLPVDEFTVEVNPEDVTDDLAQRLRLGGVTRVSMGIQSLNDAELAAIGRRHTADDARRAFARLRRVFDNISVDLIFGLPGQSVASWSRTLSEVLAIRPEHLSAYSLMWEDGTALSRMRKMGRTAPVPDETAEAMYNELRVRALEAGYEHYEISNFAQPGHASRHNSSYWDGTPYLGLGPGAHSYDGRCTRRANPADVKAYLDRFAPPASDSHHFYTEENLTPEELHEEYIMTRLRRREGIDLEDYRHRFGADRTAHLLKAAAPLIATGALHCTATHLALTEAAILRSDPVILALI